MPEQWETKKYTIRQVMLTSDWQVVWHTRGKDGSPGKLWAEPLDALALVDVLAETRERVGQTGCKVIEQEKFPGQIVGLKYYTGDGDWQIVEEFSNFAGMVRKGEDIRHGVSRLSREERAALAPEFRFLSGEEDEEE